MKCLLGIDLGTSGLKAAVFDLQGNQLAKGYAHNRYLASTAGSAEQDPDAWWQGCCQAVQAALKSTKTDARQVVGVGVCGFHHCPVLVGKHGEPVRPCIVSHDQRMQETLERLRESGIAKRVMELTGSLVAGGHFPVIYSYLREHEGSSIRASRWIMLAKDYLRYKLTGQVGTELCDATGTHLVALPEKNWSPELLDLLQVERGKLPEIASAERVCGSVNSSAAKLTGLKAGTPVAFGGGDSHCALLGLGVVEPGQVGLLLGTNSTLRITFDTLRKLANPPVWVQNHVVPGLYTASASSMAGASVLAWLKEALLEDCFQGLSDDEAYHQLDAQAAEIQPGCEGLMFLPFLHGERSPVDNLNARGSYISIGHHHRQAHFVRSLMEGIAYVTADNLAILQSLNLTDNRGPKCIHTGRSGGSLLKTWRQILTDALGYPLQIMAVEEPGCLGAALLAGIAVGEYADIRQAVARAIQYQSRISPQSDTVEVYRKRRALLSQTYRALEPVLYS